MGDGFFGISSTSWKSFLFGGETNGIIGCGNVSVQKNIVEADAASDSHSGDLSKIYPDVKPDITDISSWLDILEIDSFDSKPDVIVIPPEIIVETTQNTGDIPVDQDTNDTSDQYNFDETEAMCLSTNEIPYDHSAQNCTIDLADVDGDGFCKKDYEIENSALQCPKETGKIGTDCNDDAQNINPNAQEIACNNIDENCDAIIYLGTDNDGDGYKTDGGLCGPIDCNDEDKNIYPANPETCDGKDNNCNALTDDNLPPIEKPYSGPQGTQNVGICKSEIKVCQNGYYVVFKNEVTPGIEACNNLDDNCNGLTDDNLFKSYYSDPFGTKGKGECKAGSLQCESGAWKIVLQEVTPKTEVCDNKDNNCNGQTDETLYQSYYTGPDGTLNKGECKPGSQQCENGIWKTVFQPTTPTDEVCNNKDDNCNGLTDENLFQSYYTGLNGTLNMGECKSGSQQCVSGAWQTVLPQITPTDEICDNKDNNCNGQTDEKVVNLGMWKCNPGGNPDPFPKPANSAACFNVDLTAPDYKRLAIEFDYKAQADSCFNQPVFSVNAKGKQIANFPFYCSSNGSVGMNFCLPPNTSPADISFGLTSGDWCSSILIKSATTFADNTCDPCNQKGNYNNGKCDCFAGYTGDSCNQCASGYAGYPDCKETSISACACKTDPNGGFNCLPKGTCELPSAFDSKPIIFDGNSIASCMNEKLVPGSYKISYEYKGAGDTCNTEFPQLTFLAKTQYKVVDLLPCPGNNTGNFNVCVPNGASLSDISFSLTKGAWCSSLRITKIESSIVDACDYPTQNDQTKWSNNGFTFTAYDKNQYCNPAFLSMLHKAWMDGADTLGLLYTRYQDNMSSTNIYVDPKRTPSIESLSCAIKTIKQNYGMKVALYLYVDPQSGWRANFAPTSETDWFNSFKSYITEMAQYGNNNGIDILSVGAELNSLTKPGHLGKWQNIMNEVHNLYKGPVLYFPQWSTVDQIDMGYWKLFDAVGITYWEGLSSEPVPSTSTLVSAWSKWNSSLSAKVKAVGNGKKLFFGEIGYPSRQFCAKDPYACGNPGIHSDQCQSNAYQAFYQVWGKSDNVLGALFWQAGTGAKGNDPNMCSPDSVGCCPLYQSAESVMDSNM